MNTDPDPWQTFPECFNTTTNNTGLDPQHDFPENLNTTTTNTDQSFHEYLNKTKTSYDSDPWQAFPGYINTSTKSTYSESWHKFPGCFNTTTKRKESDPLQDFTGCLESTTNSTDSDPWNNFPGYPNTTKSKDPGPLQTTGCLNTNTIITDQDPFETFPTVNDFSDALDRISKYIHKTPVFTSNKADKISGRNLYFKAENLQKTGSFKARGALNAILKAVQSEQNIRDKGVVTITTGNHGQAVAWACSKVGVPSHIIVAETTKEVKKKAILDYGGTVVECGPLASQMFDMLENMKNEKGMKYFPSCGHLDAIAGQGTIGLEFLSQVPQLDAILVSVGGGGMAAGIAAAAKNIKPGIKVFLVTPKGKKMEECLRSRELPRCSKPGFLNTVADGLKLQAPVKLAALALMDLAEKDVFEMGEEEIIQGTKFCFERMKLVVEASAGIAVSAALSDKLKAMDPAMRHVGVILCGGNLDLDKMPWSH